MSAILMLELCLLIPHAIMAGAIIYVGTRSMAVSPAAQAIIDKLTAANNELTAALSNASAAPAAQHAEDLAAISAAADPLTAAITAAAQPAA